MVGAHYANFPGLLEPFPDDAQVVVPPAPVASPVEPPEEPVDNPSGVAAQASPGRYKATGDVLRPDGTIKKDGDDAPSPSPGGDQPEEPQAEPEVARDGDEEDDDEDRPLEDIPGVSKKLASALRKAGYASAYAVANCQTKAKLKKLGSVSGVEDAAKLAEAAQDLLGWVEDSESA